MNDKNLIRNAELCGGTVTGCLGFPRQPENRYGWVLDFDFLQSVQKRAGVFVELEAIEDILLALEDLEHGNW